MDKEICSLATGLVTFQTQEDAHAAKQTRYSGDKSATASYMKFIRLNIWHRQ